MQQKNNSTSSLNNLRTGLEHKIQFIRNYSNQNWFIFLTLIILSAFLFRIYLAINWVFDPDEAFYLYDSHLILNGLTPFEDFYTRSPLLLYLLTLFLKIFGENYVAGRLLSVVTSTITIYFVYLIGNNLYNRNVGLLASFLFAFSPFINRWAYTIVTEPTQLMFTTIAMYMLALGLKTNKKHYYLLNGIFLALSMLVRKSSFVLIFGEFVFLFFVHYDFNNLKNLKPFIRNYSTIIIGILFVFLPVAHFNYMFVMPIFSGLISMLSNISPDTMSLTSTSDTENIALYRNVLNEMGTKAFYLILPTFLFLLHPINDFSKKNVRTLYKIFFSVVGLIGLSKVIEIPFSSMFIFYIGLLIFLYSLVLIYIKFTKHSLHEKINQRSFVKIADTIVKDFNVRKYDLGYKVTVFLIGFIGIAILLINFSSGNIVYPALFVMLGIIIFTAILTPPFAFRDFVGKKISERSLWSLIIVISLLLTLIKSNYVARDFVFNFVCLLLICMAIFFSKYKMKRLQVAKYSNIFLIFWFFSIFFFYLFYRVYSVYMYELTAVSCIMTAVVVDSMRKSMPEFKNSVNIFVGLLAITMLLSQSMYIEYNQSDYTKPRHVATIVAISDYISENTNTNEEVFAAWAIYPFNAQRNQMLNLTRPLYVDSKWVQTLGYPSTNEIIDYMDENKIKYVIVDYYMNDWIFSVSPEFEQYVKENYIVCEKFGNTEIYERIK